MSGDSSSGVVILLCVDASKHAERAFLYYCDHLHRENHKVVLMHSAEYPQLTNADRMAPELWESEIARKEREMKTLEDYYKDRLKSYNISGSTKFVYHKSKPGESIVQVAESEEVGASIIILGTRGVGTLRRTFLGSTSDYVIKHIKHCSVLVCPPPPKGHDKLNYDHVEGEEEQHQHQHQQQQHHHHGILGKIFHHGHHHEHKEGKDGDAEKH